MIKSIVSQADYNKAKTFFKAIEHPTRLKVLTYLQVNGPCKVTELHNTFRMEQSLMSQHLAILRTSRIVNVERSGREMYYNVNLDAFALANETTKKIIDHVKNN